MKMCIYRVFTVILFIWLSFLCQNITTTNQSIAEPRIFGFYRTISVTQKTCTCPMSFSCSCCQNVIILYSKMEKNLCVNFTYQRNGLNMDVSLSSNTINTRTITNYKPFRFCIRIPGCLFSTACINILELNQFPMSITACLRLDIYSKKQLWQINYDCINVSTQPVIIPRNGNLGTIYAAGKLFTIGNEQTSKFLITESTTIDKEIIKTSSISLIDNITDTMLMQLSGISTLRSTEIIEQASSTTVIPGII